MAVRGARDADAYVGKTIPVGHGLCGRAVAEGRLVWSAELLREDGIAGGEDLDSIARCEQLQSGVALPLAGETDTIGALFLGDLPGHTLPAYHMHLLTAFADRAAVALEKVTLFERGAQRAAKLAVLARVASLLASATDKAEVFHAVARAAITLLGARAAQVLVDDPLGGVLRTAVESGAARQSTWPSPEPTVIPHRSGVAGAVWESRQPIFVEDVQDEPRWIDGGVAREHDLHAYAGLPLIARHRAVGVLSILFGERRAFTQEEREVMALLADQAAIAIDNARLFAETEQRRQAAEALSRVGRVLSQSLDVGEVARQIAASTQELMRVSAFAVHRLDPASGDLVPVTYSSDVGPVFGGGRPLARGTGTAGLAVREARTILTRDFLVDPRIVIRADDRRLFEAASYRAVLSIPLFVRGRVTGVLSLGRPAGATFSDGDIEIAQAFADQAAVALENARLFAETERRRRAAEALAEVGRLMAQSLDPEEVAALITQSVQALLAVDNVALYRLRSETQELVSVSLRGDHGPTGELPIVYPLGLGAVGLAAQSRRPIVTGDVLAASRIPQPPAQLTRMEQAPFRSVLALPLIVQDQVVGALALGDRVGRLFSEDEVQIVQAFADRAAVALQHARLFAETERRRRSAEALAEVGRLMAQSLDPQEMSDLIAESVQTLLGVKSVVLFHLRPETQELVSVSIRGDAGPTDGRAIVYPLGWGVVGVAAQTHRPVVTPDVVADPDIPQPPEALARIRQAPFRSVVALPLIVQDRVVGALSFGDRLGRVYSKEDVQIAHAFADRAALALETARLYQQVRAAHDFLKSIAESSADAIVTTDTHGHITYWSPGAEEALGHRAEELLGRSMDALYRSGRVEADRIRQRLGDEGRIPDYETSMRAKDGSWRDVTAAFSLLRDVGGAVTGTLAVVKDITERRKLEESLRQSQKMEAVGRLAGGIAHDFNNLMTIVIGRTELLLTRLRPEDPVRHDIELFRRTAERAAALTRQLLAFSRKQVLQPRVFDLNVVVAHMESMLRRLIGEDIELTIRLDPRLHPIKADPGQLEQVIVNLAVNARDAMPHGGQLTIETATVELDRGHARGRGIGPREPWVMLAVHDTGVGMDDKTVARIFEPFFTTKETGKGTGLGLSTVYGIVQQSGGDIHVRSQPGRGTTFAIYFPPESAVSGPDDEALGAPEASGRRQAILLVEDEVELRGVVRQMLEHYGYVVLEARHAAEAVWLAEHHSGTIHLLLTDVVMPDMSGRELARRVSACRPGTKIVFMSGYTDDAIVHQGVLDEGTTFLEKPFSAEQLAVKIHEVLAPTES